MFRSNKTRKGARGNPAHGRRPVVEAMEPRQMLSTTIFVNSGSLEPLTENKEFTNNTVAIVSAYSADGKVMSDLSGFTAQITWGDGETSDGAIGEAVSAYHFSIEGSHKYVTAGLYPISVHVVAADGTSADAQVEQANVRDAAITSTPRMITATAGEEFTKTLATLIDSNPDEPATNFTATLTWGDSTPDDPAQIVSVGKGQYQVIGTHTYAKAGRYYANVAIVDDHGYATSTNCLVDVSAAPVANPVAPSDPVGPTAPTPPVQPPVDPVSDPAPTTDPSAPLAWGKKVSPEFKAKVTQIAQSLGANPNDLMAAMAFESGQTFSPKIRNRLSGATGLIQFMPSTAKRYGTTTAALAKMSAVEQLDYVQRYLQPYAGRLNTLSDVYMSILWPAAVGKGEDYAIFSKGTKAYAQNKGLDTNHDGKVTKGEAASRVQTRLDAGKTPAYFG